MMPEKLKPKFEQVLTPQQLEAEKVRLLGLGFNEEEVEEIFELNRQRKRLEAEIEKETNFETKAKLAEKLNSTHKRLIEVQKIMTRRVSEEKERKMLEKIEKIPHKKELFEYLEGNLKWEFIESSDNIQEIIAELAELGDEESLKILFSSGEFQESVLDWQGMFGYSPDYMIRESLVKTDQPEAYQYLYQLLKLYKIDFSKMAEKVDYSPSTPAKGIAALSQFEKPSIIQGIEANFQARLKKDGKYTYYILPTLGKIDSGLALAKVKEIEDLAAQGKVEIAYEYFEALFYLIDLFLEEGKQKEAEKVFDYVKKRNLQIHLAHGLAIFARHRYKKDKVKGREEFEKAFQEALAVPDNPQPRGRSGAPIRGGTHKIRMHAVQNVLEEWGQCEPEKAKALLEKYRDECYEHQFAPDQDEAPVLGAIALGFAREGKGKEAIQMIHDFGNTWVDGEIKFGNFWEELYQAKGIKGVLEAASQGLEFVGKVELRVGKKYKIPLPDKALKFIALKNPEDVLELEEYNEHAKHFAQYGRLYRLKKKGIKIPPILSREARIVWLKDMFPTFKDEVIKKMAGLEIIDRPRASTQAIAHPLYFAQQNGIEEAEKPELSRKEIIEAIYEREKKRIKEFFGKEIKIPALQKEQISKYFEIKEKDPYFDLHYLPREQISEAKILTHEYEKDIDKQLPGKWVIVDTHVPDKDLPADPYYKDEIIGGVIRKLRQADKLFPRGKKHTLQISSGKVIEETQEDWEKSRYGISCREWQETVIPELAKELNLKESPIRLPKAIEAYWLNEVFYEPFFGISRNQYGAKKDEWLDEGVKGGQARFVDYPPRLANLFQPGKGKDTRSEDIGARIIIEL